MAFIDGNNILVLEKNSGEVRLVSNGILQEQPVLKLDVDATTLTCCRGLWALQPWEKKCFFIYQKPLKTTSLCGTDLQVSME
jgi:hypothetical protein